MVLMATSEKLSTYRAEEIAKNAREIGVKDVRKFKSLYDAALKDPKVVPDLRKHWQEMQNKRASHSFSDTYWEAVTKEKKKVFGQSSKLLTDLLKEVEQQAAVITSTETNPLVVSKAPEKKGRIAVTEAKIEKMKEAAKAIEGKGIVRRRSWWDIAWDGFVDWVGQNALLNYIIGGVVFAAGIFTWPLLPLGLVWIAVTGWCDAHYQHFHPKI
jgi:hypothetical protein